MQLVSFRFLAFLFATALVYIVCPKKIRYIWLLITSVAFYYLVSPTLLLLLLAECIISYLTGFFVCEKEGRSIYLRDGVLATGATCLVLILVVFKYSGFFLETFGDVKYFLGLGLSDLAVSLAIPLGISFYTLQAIGYVADCYKGRVAPEKNFLRLSLFIIFFLQITSGPIERAGNMLPQYKEPKSFSYDDMREGLLLMLWGYFQKIIIADRLGVMVGTIFSNYEVCSGTLLMIGTLFYSMQLYCDFAGYSNIVVGGAKLMGINLTHNFNAPYLSETISEFWRRWHISLSSWFRDYVYIPLGGNRKGTVRKLINIIIVFILCGLWHGAAWTFVVLGLLHGLFQVFGDVLGPVRDKGAQILRIRRNGFSHRLLKKVITFTLVNLSWVFFRSPSIDEALYIITHMWQITPWVITQGELFTLGLERIDVMLVLYALALQIGVDIFNHKGIQLRHVITRQSLPLRWLIYIVAVVFVLTCGIWGPGSASVPFIYSGF